MLEVTKRADEERTRLQKEYQREMRELYKDLNERSQKLQELQTEMTAAAEVTSPSLSPLFAEKPRLDLLQSREVEVADLKSQLATLTAKSSGAAAEVVFEQRRAAEELSAMHQEWTNHGRVGKPLPVASCHSSVIRTELEGRFRSSACPVVLCLCSVACLCHAAVPHSNGYFLSLSRKYLSTKALSFLSSAFSPTNCCLPPPRLLI